MGDEFGHDVVTDFEVGKDKLDALNWGDIFDLNDAKELATEVDGGVLIVQGEDSVFLAGVALDDLTARDFVFGWP